MLKHIAYCCSSALALCLGLALVSQQAVANSASASDTPASGVGGATASTIQSTLAQPRPDTTLTLVRHTLANGLQVVLNEDHSAPTVAVCVTYDVGSRNELEGRSGFAHLFEHMMFQGSQNVPKGDHFTWVAGRGGSLNGTTSDDRTNYYEVVPSSGLATVLWLESDRMKSLSVTQSNFENQRKVVQEEYRMRISNAPYAEGLVRLRQLSFSGYWPYAHPTIGSMSDLDSAELEWIQDFHNSYYGPNNAVLAISGDFEPNATLQLVEDFFGGAKRADVPQYSPPAEPAQIAPRKEVVADGNAKTPAIYQGWVIPPYRTGKHYALELALLILSYGDSSTLHQALVLELAQVQSVSAWTYDHRGPDLLVIKSILSETGEVETVQAVIDEHLTRLATEGPSATEVLKAKQQMQSIFLFGLEGNAALARYLARYELFFGDANLLAAEIPNFMKVSAKQIRTAVQRYLSPNRRSTIVVEPASTAPAPAPSVRPSSGLKDPAAPIPSPALKKLDLPPPK